MLQKYYRGASKHVYDIVTGDVSWIYAYEPESKQQSIVWVFQDEPNPTKDTRARSTSKQMIAYFFRKTGHIAIVPLEQHITVSSEWYTTISLQVVFKESQPPKADHFSPRQCETSHIGSNNCIFKHSKHRFDELSAV